MNSPAPAPELICNKPYGVPDRFTPEPLARAQGHHRPAERCGRATGRGEGLLLLTGNLGALHSPHQPRATDGKTYWVQVEGRADATARRGGAQRDGGLVP
jgi:16S rRNA U516 pseudouridylate synthase RsuA-like enzyme